MRLEKKSHTFCFRSKFFSLSCFYKSGRDTIMFLSLSMATWREIGMNIVRGKCNSGYIIPAVEWVAVRFLYEIRHLLPCSQLT